VWFLTNVLLHKGRVNQSQLTPEFFSLLRIQNCDVNVAALTEFLGEKFPVFDVCRRLKDLLQRVARIPMPLGRCIRSSKVVADGDHSDKSILPATTSGTLQLCHPAFPSGGRPFSE
jgi:hypothetical protein